jgi:hypothetical protein
MVDLSAVTAETMDFKYQSFAIKAASVPEPARGSQDRKEANLDLTELTPDGRVADRSKALAVGGFEVGNHVKRKDGVSGVISSFTTDKITLKLDAAAIVTMDIADFLKDAWVKFQPKSAPEPVDASKLLPSRCAEYEAHVMKAKVMLEMHSLIRKHDSVLSNLTVFNKPRSVQVNANYSKGSMILVPAAFRIMHKAGGRDVCGPDQLHAGDIMPGMQFWFAAPGQNEFISPFWCVQIVNDRDKANLELFQWKSQSLPNLQIPCYRNVVKLYRDDCLTVFKKVDKKSKFSDLGLDAAQEVDKKKAKKGIKP